MVMKEEDMIAKLQDLSKKDENLFSLLEKAREYARVYHFAKERQKGCNGMGEVATLKDEFNSVIKDLLYYTSDEGDIPSDTICDIDEVVRVLLK
jgi:hypothetical protein